MKVRYPFFKTIVADPPWPEYGGGQIKRGADKHYDLLSKEEILDTMLSAEVWLPDQNGCHLYLWVTNNYLPSGLWVMKGLGFQYKTNRVWVKNRIGIGYYFRGQHEMCLFGVRGKLAPLSRSVSTVTMAKRDEHSVKPSAFYRAIEKVSPGPRLDMFSRRDIEGWVCWGNELKM